MSGGIAPAVLAVLTLVVLATVSHALVVLVVLAVRRPRIQASSDELPAVTWFRPLKAGVEQLGIKLTAYLRSLPAGDQVLLGVDAGSEVSVVAQEVARDFGGWVEVIECKPGAARNPKVSKLHQMSAFARHELWIVADAEAEIDAAFATAFRREWQQTKADVLTAGYRFTGTTSYAQRLDAMSTVLTFWPGLELVRAFGAVRFTLGACTAFRSADLESIGGWRALENELAEDYWLGALISRVGKEVRLSEAIITLHSDPMTAREYWRHQLRVAATYRAARPLGTAGMILTRGVTASLLAILIHPVVGMLLFSFARVFRVALAECMARLRGLPLNGSPIGLVIISDVVESVAWVLAWFSRKVWWAGRARRISWRGQLKD